LEDLGWNVIVVWECETDDSSCLLSKIQEILTRKRIEATKVLI